MSDDAWFRLSIFFAVLALMALWESAAPRRALVQGYRRWPANLGIVLLDSLMVRLLLPAGAVGVALWAEAQGYGLLNLAVLPDAVAIVVAVVLLDLAIYLQHLLVHAVPLFWRFHMVHHVDRDIDVTTALRFHPVEILFSMLLKMAVVLLIGAPAIAVVLFEVILNGMAMFNHANAELPNMLDRIVRTLFVTPDMHRVHHSVIKRETNSNYGFNLSVWDRLFGTYRAQPEHGHQGMMIGLEPFQSAPAERLWWMLRLPFVGGLSHDGGDYPILSSGKREKKADE